MRVVANMTRVYSPLTLSQDWPTVGRLMFMLTCSCLGTVINGFFVAGFFVENSLKKIGNVFLACIGMADLIITSGVMPVSAMLLLSGQWDSVPVCQAMQFLTETSTYSYSMFFTLVALETYVRICLTSSAYRLFISMRMDILTTSIFSMSFVLGGVGVYLGLDYDYCQRLHHGNYHFRLATSIIFHGIPFLVTIICLVSASLRVRRRARGQTYYKRSQQYERDFSTTNLNIAAYCLYVFGWTPYLIVSNEFPNTTDNKFYHCVWLGISRSLVTSIVYSSLNRNFRHAFAHIFYYCCCKTTLPRSDYHRQRRVVEYRHAKGNVRVHIMQQAVNFTAPQRAACSSRDSLDL